MPETRWRPAKRIRINGGYKTKAKRRAAQRKFYIKWVATTGGYKLRYRLDAEKYRMQERQCRKRHHDAAIAFLGSKCANPNCRHLNEDGSLGCTDVRLLQIDHPNRNGYIERRTCSNATIYKKVLKSKPGKYRLLCASCNWLHRVEDF